MRKITILMVVIGLVFSSNCQISLKTIIFDGTSQPPIVGGHIKGFDNNLITKKGVLIGLDSSSLFVDSSSVFKVVSSNPYIGNSPPSNDNINVDCSVINKEQFAVRIKGLLSNTEYYVKSFVFKDNDVFYGEVQKFQTQIFNRSSSRLDYANVWHAYTHTLFDLRTDEIINRSEDGFYYTGILVLLFHYS